MHLKELFRFGEFLPFYPRERIRACSFQSAHPPVKQVKYTCNNGMADRKDHLCPSLPAFSHGTSLPFHNHPYVNLKR